MRTLPLLSAPLLSSPLLSPIVSILSCPVVCPRPARTLDNNLSYCIASSPLTRYTIATHIFSLKSSSLCNRVKQQRSIVGRRQVRSHSHSLHGNRRTSHLDFHKGTPPWPPIESMRTELCSHRLLKLNKKRVRQSCELKSSL